MSSFVPEPVDDFGVLDRNFQAIADLLLLGSLVFTGSGVPAFTPPGPVALFLRRDGGVGSSLYSYEAGGWVAK